MKRLRKRNKQDGAKVPRSRQQKLAMAASIVMLVALAVVPTLAWLSYQRSLQTVTMVNRPNAMIGAGDVRPIMELDLSDIDVSGGNGYKDIVFCVYCATPTTYNLQLSHTTNIGFTYTIYPASLTKSDVSDSQVNYLGKDYYFCTDKTLAGGYLNLESGEDKLAATDGTCHNITYGTYTNVQKNAEPLYWQTAKPCELKTKQGTSGYYVDYYVLRVAWDGSVQNNKETDLVYLMAGGNG